MLTCAMNLLLVLVSLFLLWSCDATMLSAKATGEAAL